MLPILTLLTLLTSPAPSLRIHPHTITWTPAPPSMPPGTRIAILEGDPKKDAIFTMRLLITEDGVLLPHTHPNDERVTVLNGSVKVGQGSTIDCDHAEQMSAGAYYVNPAGTLHYVCLQKDTQLQITTLGPWGVDYKP